MRYISILQCTFDIIFSHRSARHPSTPPSDDAPLLLSIVSLPCPVCWKSTHNAEKRKLNTPSTTLRFHLHRRPSLSHRVPWFSLLSIFIRHSSPGPSPGRPRIGFLRLIGRLTDLHITTDLFPNPLCISSWGHGLREPSLYFQFVYRRSVTILTSQVAFPVNPPT